MRFNAVEPKGFEGSKGRLSSAENLIYAGREVIAQVYGSSQKEDVRLLSKSKEMALLLQKIEVHLRRDSTEVGKRLKKETKLLLKEIL